MANLNFNKAILAGRLTNDPELKKAGDLSLTGFTIAINRKNSKGNNIADFINCEAWRGTAEFITKFFHKGDSIMITGSIKTDKYEDKDGQKRTKTFVNVEEATFVDSKSEKTESYETCNEDNLPF